MDRQRRRELMEQFNQIKTYMGAVKITNTVNGKIFIDTFPNLKNQWLTIKMQLDMGRHPNSGLQRDWKEMGEEAFTYEVIEEKETDDMADVRYEVKKLKKLWLEKLQPYEDKGYNRPPR